MKIGIDGGALSITDDRLKVGTYRVTYNLVKELPRIDVKSFYRIYSFDRGEEGIPKLSYPNVEFIRLPRPGFSKLWQSLELVRNPVQAYLGISQSLPAILCDVRKIGFIYDVGFLEHPEYYRESFFTLQSQTSDVIKRSSHIITISDASAGSICKRYGIPMSKLTVAYLGVEKIFRPNGKRYQAPRPYILFVGALKPGKNLPMMLRAFAEFLRVSKKSYDFFLIGSDYWLDPAISSTINILNLKHRVHILGFVDDETLATYYRGATALLNVSCIEGFGLPVVEAMASGCPVIGSSAGANPEVISDSGILVDPEDIQSLVRALQQITSESSVRARLRECGIKRAKKFTWTQFAATVFDVTRANTPHS